MHYILSTKSFGDRQCVRGNTDFTCDISDAWIQKSLDEALRIRLHVLAMMDAIEPLKHLDIEIHEFVNGDLGKRLV